MVRVWVRVRVRVRLGDTVVRNAVGRKVGNPYLTSPQYLTSITPNNFDFCPLLGIP